MKTARNRIRSSTTHIPVPLIGAVATALCVAALPVSVVPIAAAAGFKACSSTAGYLKRACFNDVRDDMLTEIANCQNIAERSERRACSREARMEINEARDECTDVLDARLDLCDAIGEDPYDPEFGEDYADNFIEDPTEIGNTVVPNTYLPLVPGSQWIYEGTFEEDGEEITETITVFVTDKIKNIDGIPCLVVNDIAEVDGVVVEDTDDWFTQDLAGNVWYCGEIAENFELFDGDDPEDPELVDIDGSWKSGRDGAKAGIQMPAVPVVGQIIRQEVAWGEAEDVIEILSLTETESSPFANCTNDCLETRDFTPIEPGVNEHKFYAPGVGMILEVDDEDNRVELISYSILP